MTANGDDGVTRQLEAEPDANWLKVRYHRLSLHNFLSHQQSSIELDDLTALVGPNASGKSNAVAAFKLLRDIPQHGLPTAVARRGGFDQLRHRSSRHPADPMIRLDFSLNDAEEASFYELHLGALKGKRYEVRQERASVLLNGRTYEFDHKRGHFTATETRSGGLRELVGRIPPGQSAVAGGTVSFGAHLVGEVLQAIQTVEINPAKVGELQEPSSTREFEPDGSTTSSIFDELGPDARVRLLDELSAIIPGVDRIEVRRLADKLTLTFFQDTTKGRREFLAKQMSDGTLRAFGILLSLLQPSKPSLVVVEEPEVAIHLGALRTLIDILQQAASDTQVVITTHSADIIDSLTVDNLRVVWSNDGASQVSSVAAHMRDPVRMGLITPGELLRSDSLDPEVA